AMMRCSRWSLVAVLAAPFLPAPPARAVAEPAGDYWVCVTNERSDDLSVFDGPRRERIATIPLGRRPRGIYASPDGRYLYVALSGSPISGPPGSGAPAAK